MTTSPTLAIREIPVAQIKAGPNDRKEFQPEALAELAESIRVNGLAQPITIRPVGTLPGTKKPLYEIAAGERRFRAMALVLKRETVPAIVKQMTDQEASALMLAENTGRKDLNPIEEAEAYQARVDRFGWSHAKIAGVAGVREDIVGRRISLLRLFPDAQKLVATRQLSTGHAECMTELDPNRQVIALRVYRESTGILVGPFRILCGQLLNEQQQDGLFDISALWVEHAKAAAAGAKPGQPGSRVTRTDLPEIGRERADTADAICKRYIRRLEAAGMQGEAQAVILLHETLIERRAIQAFAGVVDAPDPKEPAHAG